MCEKLTDGGPTGGETRVAHRDPGADAFDQAAIPLVTVVVPMRNEALQIGRCLQSIARNRLPGQTFEILVVDGASGDGSAEIVAELARADTRIRLIPNPARIQSAAFNLALEQARGEYIVRMDAHAHYEPDYLAESVRLLRETGAVNVGGVQSAAGTTFISRAIAAAVSSPFAAGDAKYRNATGPAWVDTVFLGAWRTEDLRAIGGMRTDLAVNEDYEMNVRLRNRGGRIYLSPTIRSTYFVRGSLPKLARQYGRYGFWKVRTLLDHPQSVRLRQLVAPLFVLALLATPFAVARLGWAGGLIVMMYVTSNLAASVATAARTSWANLATLPLIFLTIHLAWGGGFWVGLARWTLAGKRDPDVAF